MASSDRVVADLVFMGFLFESMVIRDLRIYAQQNDATVYQYHDDENLEFDAIVEARDGRYIAVEIKLGAHRIDQAAGSLLRFNGLSCERGRKPTAAMVITANGYAYTRPDGFIVTPISCLGP